MELVAEAVDRYLAGDPVGCVWALLPELPDTDVRNHLLLFTALGDLAMDDLLEQIAPLVAEQLERLESSDPELRDSFAIALGSEEASADVLSYKRRGSPRLAFWASRQHARRGRKEVADALARYACEEGEKTSVESFLACRMSNRQPDCGRRPTEIQRGRLALRIALKIRRYDLIEEIADKLIADGDPDASLEAVVARANVLEAQGEADAATELVVAHRALVSGAGGEALAQVAWMLLRLNDASAPSMAIVDEVFAAISDDPAAAASVATVAVCLHEIDSTAHWPRVLRVVVENDLLADADDQAFHVLGRCILGEGSREALEYLDDSCHMRPRVDLETTVAAAISAHRASDSGAQGAERLLRTATAVKKCRSLPAGYDHIVMALMRELHEALEFVQAGEVAEAILAKGTFAIPDEARLSLALEGAANLVYAGDVRRASELLDACAVRMTGPLEEGDTVRDQLLLALAQLASLRAPTDKTISYLYELRYRLETSTGKSDSDALVGVLKLLSEVFECLGCYGVAQRYLREPQLRPDLGDASEPTERERERLSRMWARGTEGREPQSADQAGGEPSERSAKSDASDVSDTATPPVDPIRPLAEELAVRSAAGDVDATVVLSEHLLSRIESDELTGTMWHTAVEEGLALCLILLGSHDRAIDHWIDSTRGAVGQIAALAAAGPTDDLREASESLARRGEMILSAAKDASPSRMQQCLTTFVALRSLWVDLRILRREAGGDSASLLRERTVKARREIARRLFDGPTRDISKFSDYSAALLEARRRRDLEEIAGMYGRTDGSELARQLHQRFSESVEALGDTDVFLGYFRVGSYEFSSRSLQIVALQPTSERYVAIVLRRGEYTMVPIGEIDVVDALVDDFPDLLRSAVQTRARDARPFQFATALLRAVVDPVAELVRGAKTIQVMGEGSLAELPWQVLFEQRDLGAVRQVQSFRGIARSRADAVRLDPRALVVGRPDYGPPDPDVGHEGIRQFADLPSTEVEATTVAEQCGCVAALGSRANVDAILDSAPIGVLHLASHGFGMRPNMDAELLEFAFDRLGADMFAPREDFIPGPLDANRARDPLLHAGIALAGVNIWLGENGRAAWETGILTAEDLSWCALDEVDCVVLSACSSGVGKGSRAFGSRGMRLASIVAGASWAITSLWPVPDVATAVMIEWLYEEFGKGTSPPDALTAAQTRLRRAEWSKILRSRTIQRLQGEAGCSDAKRYLEGVAYVGEDTPFAHPYFWCGFVCSG